MSTVVGRGSRPEEPLSGTPRDTAAVAGSIEAVPAAGVLVLLGGVPGAGKSSLIAALNADRPGVRTIDPDELRRRLAAALPDGVRYRWYRPLVHTVNAVRVFGAILRGPRGDAPLVVHDPATRSRRREFTGRLARRRGWRPVLVVLEVSREEALAGQHARGRVVAATSFERHWRRWTRQRLSLHDRASRLADAWPWTSVLIVERPTARAGLHRALGPAF